MRIVTIFNGILDKTNAKYFDVDVVLEQIRLCALQPKIDAIRTAKTLKEQKELKKSLPCICFSGAFSERYDDRMTEHSGLAIVDYDHVENLLEKKAELEKLPYVYSVFISPSGDGLKVLIRIPADIKRHRGHYNALKKVFPDMDKTSINESRVCFASADATIYINKDAVEFTDYEEPVKAIAVQVSEQRALETNYHKLAVGARIIRESIDGEKHIKLIHASKLMGGFIAGGVVDEHSAIFMLESEISNKNIEDFEGARKTIRDGIRYGKNHPIFEEPDFKNYDNTPTSTLVEETIDGKYPFVTTIEDTAEYLEQVMNGTFQMGLTTGFPEFDKYFRFKFGNLVVNLGHDNVGKSFVTWYFAVVSAVLHGWKWIIFSSENKTGMIVRKLIEFKTCTKVTELTPEQYDEARQWVDANFRIIKNDAIYTYKDLLKMGEAMMEEEVSQGFLIDPYNSLWKDVAGGREHEYDYKAFSEYRLFGTKYNCAVWVNCHAVTEALRRLYPKGHDYEGHPMPPNKADAEGGGKVANRADDFMVTHRLVSHKSDWMWTQIHIRKIKEYETGGHQTPIDEPYMLKMMHDSLGFEDSNGFSPLRKVGYTPKATPTNLNNIEDSGLVKLRFDEEFPPPF